MKFFGLILQIFGGRGAAPFPLGRYDVKRKKKSDLQAALPKALKDSATLPTARM